ncbi:hypothetical protein FSP39_025031 [Pinctada imbricata]|uniref:Neurotransmitter-gated ion-channel ligand-binding domain-containing protein n=1 Tax=Pinctada imbricata TaxID=66713 RepID=A0AA89C253_PINIB|nr:hypothetical protein FSP39_025031 [Pinctada imbricata]
MESPTKSSAKEQPLTTIFRRLIVSLDKNNQVLEKVSKQLQYHHPGSQAQIVYENNREEEDATGQINEHDQVHVEVKLTFMKINDIDTVTQQFEAEIFVQAKWEEPYFLKNPSKEFNPDTMWTPKLLIMNLDGEFQTSRMSYTIVKDVVGYDYPLVLCLWRFKGFFKENLELEHFPMDVQDLTISVSTELSQEEILLTEDRQSMSSVNTKTFMDAQEWTIFNHVETYRDKTTVEYASSTVHPILHVSCRVARKIGYFVWNIIFIVLLIISLTFATFTIEPSSADRLAVTITLFLTAVAFKLVVKQSLPTISYLTYLDLYVLAALMFLGLHATQNACLKHLAANFDKVDVEIYDNYSMISLTATFVLFHAIFGTYIFLTATRRRRLMFEKDKIYKIRKAEVEKYITGTPMLTDISVETPKSKGSLETLPLA